MTRCGHPSLASLVRVPLALRRVGGLCPTLWIPAFAGMTMVLAGLAVVLEWSQKGMDCVGCYRYPLASPLLA